jgi:hypothetical protein
VVDDNAKVLRAAFMAGAVTDAAAMVPMLSHWAAKVFWGLEEVDGKYKYAMGYGSALMAGWTSLLLWAYSKPVARRFVALLTVQVILGFVAVEIWAVRTGTVGAKKLVPTWLMQTLLLTVFIYGYVKAAPEGDAT